MTRLGDDSISRSKIPILQVLCQDLGFDTTVSQRNFRDSVTNWRKTYKTASGKSGTALLDWESFDERYNLGVMAQEFVETGSNAHDFWPSDGGTSRVKPRYLKDEATILQLLRRLMWRQNQYMAEANRKSKDAINDERSGSEDHPPPTGPQKSQPPPPSHHQVRPGSANSTLTTSSSSISLKREDRGNSEENMQGQSSQQKRPHPRPLGSNYIESESNKRSRMSMPSELHSTSSQALASDLEPSNDLDNPRSNPRKNVQLGNSESPQSQTGPSQKESSPSTTAQADVPNPTLRPEVNIFVVESSGPHITIKKWPGGTLRGRTLKSIFEEVSTTFPEQSIQRIKFQLQTLRKEHRTECLIERDDDQVFEVMLQEFNERIKGRMRAGETRFKLFLKPDHGLQGATKAAVSEGPESEENYV